MISDPSFAEAHRSRSAAALLFSVPGLCSLRSKCTLVSIKAGEARRPIAPVFSHLIISHSVNGLVCTYESKSYRKPSLSPLFQKPSLPPLSPVVIVYNLSTRDRVTLPPTIYAGAGFYTQFNSLGFDPSTNTYKILRVWVTDGACKYEIFTLGGGGAWRIIEDGPPVYGLTTKGICLNGTIYWAKTRPVQGEEYQNIMIAFDVGEEKFRNVPFPTEAPAWKGMTWNKIEIDGHIAILDFHDVVESVGNVMTIDVEIGGFCKWSLERGELWCRNL